MKTALTALVLIAGAALAQERCDVSSPSIFCNTTEIFAYESSECTPYHIFLTRGSDEPYPGRLGNITKEICAGIGKKDCGFENILFPAKSTAWGVNEWCKSAGTGATNGQKQMKAYSKRCPDTKLMLLGFSQGGAVAQDILEGGGGDVFACNQDINPALDEKVGKKVIAAATFGAVIRSRDTNFTIGDGKPFDGRRARTTEQLSALERYSNVFLDYCHFGDPMCAVGSTPENVEHHLNYFVQHNEEVISWVVGMAKANQGAVSDSNLPSRPQPGAASSVPIKSAAADSPSLTAIMSPSATDGNEASSARNPATENTKKGSALSPVTKHASFAAAVLVELVVALLLTATWI